MTSRRRWLEIQSEKATKQESAAAMFAFIQGRRKPVGRALKTGEGGVSLVEEAARNLLRHLGNSEDLKASVTEMREQLGMSEEAGISIKEVTQQSRNENGQHIVEIFRQGEEEVWIASWARWNAQLARSG